MECCLYILMKNELQEIFAIDYKNEAKTQVTNPLKKFVKKKRHRV